MTGRNHHDVRTMYRSVASLDAPPFTRWNNGSHGGANMPYLLGIDQRLQHCRDILSEQFAGWKTSPV